jgi:NADH-quinone oxidoreductase subunit G
MLEKKLRGYVLLGNEPELDCGDPATACKALSGAELVVAITPFDVRETVDADVMLPATPWAEMDGTFVNCEGVKQSFTAAVAPFAEARPAWKILRVMGNFCGASGFDYVSIDDVRGEIDYVPGDPRWGFTRKRWNDVLTDRADNEIDLVRITDVPPLRIDGIVRRAPALQRARDNPGLAAHLNTTQVRRLNLDDGDLVHVHAGSDMVRLPVLSDERVPEGCVYIPAGFSEIAILGAATALRVVRGV